MVRTKIVCRVLDADGRLLGWEQHQAAINGDGMIRAASAVSVPVDESGTATAISWHWADVNVETRVPIPPTPVTRGAAFVVANANDPMIVCGSIPQGLPTISTRNAVQVAVPEGRLGAAPGVLKL